MDIFKNKVVWIAFAIWGFISNCQPNKDNSNDANLVFALLSLQQIPVSTARDLVNESHEDYALNEWGLIEHSTLKNWVDNWSVNKPKHIPKDGKLIILQINKANKGGGQDFIPSKPQDGVYTYLLDEFRFNEKRDTGLVYDSVAYQASGEKADEWLRLYGINLQKDLVVFANGEGSAFSVQDLTRGIYWLRYWGASIKNLALLNGNINKNYSGNLVATSSPIGVVDNGGFSVKRLRVDNTILTLALEDVLAIVDDNLQTKRVRGLEPKQFIIDARPTNQFTQNRFGDVNYSGNDGQYITTSVYSSGPPAEGSQPPKTYVLFEGHIKGAKSFPWITLLTDATTGFRYKPKEELWNLVRTYLEDPTITKESRINIVSQCRTNFEVQVNGFATLNILGLPTVYYDGSLVEWTSLVSDHPDSEFNLKPSDPAYRFRTDIETRSVSLRNGPIAYNLDLGEGRVKQAKINRNATTTRKLQLEDKAYKR